MHHSLHSKATHYSTLFLEREIKEIDKTLEDAAIAGVALDRLQTRVTVNDLPDNPQALSALFDDLGEAGGLLPREQDEIARCVDRVPRHALSPGTAAPIVIATPRKMRSNSSLMSRARSPGFSD
jgi:hypothetical protein